MIRREQMNGSEVRKEDVIGIGINDRIPSQRKHDVVGNL